MPIQVQAGISASEEMQLESMISSPRECSRALMAMLTDREFQLGSLSQDSTQIIKEDTFLRAILANTEGIQTTRIPGSILDSQASTEPKEGLQIHLTTIVVQVEGHSQEINREASVPEASAV
jgi:hypothetical protein